MTLKPLDTPRTDMSTPPLEPGPWPRPPGIIQASLLFQGSQEILIGHNGETYRLRITKNDKLILTK